MPKFTSSEALQILKKAHSVQRRRRCDAAAIKIAAIIKDKQMAKSAIDPITLTLLGMGLTAATVAGVHWLMNRGEAEKAQALVKQELAKLRTDVQADYAKKMETMRPRVFMASPKAPKPQPEPLQLQPQPEPLQLQPQPQPQPQLQPQSQPQGPSNEPFTFESFLNAFKNAPQQGDRMPTQAPRPQSMKELFESVMSSSLSGREEQPPSLFETAQGNRLPSHSMNDLFEAQFGTRIPNFEDISMGGPKPSENSFEMKPTEFFPEVPTLPKYASSMSKRAGYENIFLMFIKPIMSKLLAQGAKITPQFMKKLFARLGGSAARGIGAGAAGSKLALGKVMEKLPTNFLKSRGANMVAATKPYFGAGVARPYFSSGLAGGAAPAARQQLGRNIAKRVAGSAGGVASQIGTYGAIDDAANFVSGDQSPSFDPQDVDADKIERANQLMSWLESTQGGIDNQQQLLPAVPQNVTMTLPGYDLTEILMPDYNLPEIPMGEVNAPNKSAG
jgi:hypothetical protein